MGRKTKEAFVCHASIQNLEIGLVRSLAMAHVMPSKLFNRNFFHKRKPQKIVLQVQHVMAWHVLETNFYYSKHLRVCEFKRFDWRWLAWAKTKNESKNVTCCVWRKNFLRFSIVVKISIKNFRSIFIIIFVKKKPLYYSDCSLKKTFSRWWEEKRVPRKFFFNVFFTLTNEFLVLRVPYSFNILLFFYYYFAGYSSFC